MSSEYERLRLKNIADNKRILAELGLRDPFKGLPKVIKKPVVIKRKRPSSPVRAQKRPRKEDDLENYGSVRGQIRRSSRLKGKPPSEESELDESVNGSTLEEDDEDYGPRTPRVAPNRPNFYGAVPGIPVGMTWQTRMQCCADGVQRPTVAGIHQGPDGAYSLALSGGYEDDIDMGECFTYTGEGGRDLKGTKANPKNLRTAAQSKDQALTRGNLALSRSVETGNLVRVLRGYKLRSPFAPEEGYRYDGLYKVEKYWFTIGMSGFGVFKFALKRIEDQAPPPWTIKEDGSDEEGPDSENKDGDVPDSQDSGLGSETQSDAESTKDTDSQPEVEAETITKDTEEPKEDAEKKEDEDKAAAADDEEAESGMGDKVSETDAPKENQETETEATNHKNVSDDDVVAQKVECNNNTVQENEEKISQKNDLNNNAEAVVENTA